MKWDRRHRKFWRIGERESFRLSAKRSQSLLFALALCDGQVHESFSLDVQEGVTRHNQRAYEIAVVFSVSLPVGSEARFEEIMGAPGILEEPKVAHVN